MKGRNIRSAIWRAGTGITLTAVALGALLALPAAAARQPGPASLSAAGAAVAVYNADQQPSGMPRVSTGPHGLQWRVPDIGQRTRTNGTRTVARENGAYDSDDYYLNGRYYDSDAFYVEGQLIDPDDATKLDDDDDLGYADADDYPYFTGSNGELPVTFRPGNGRESRASYIPGEELPDYAEERAERNGYWDWNERNERE